MVSAVSSTALTCTSSGSRTPSSCSMAALGPSSSLCLKASSCRLLSTSLRSTSARPPPAASVMVLPPFRFYPSRTMRSPLVRRWANISQCPHPGRRALGIVEGLTCQAPLAVARRFAGVGGIPAAGHLLELSVRELPALTGRRGTGQRQVDGVRGLLHHPYLHLCGKLDA